MAQHDLTIRRWIETYVSGTREVINISMAPDQIRRT